MTYGAEVRTGDNAGAREGQTVGERKEKGTEQMEKEGKMDSQGSDLILLLMMCLKGRSTSCRTNNQFY